MFESISAIQCHKEGKKNIRAQFYHGLTTPNYLTTDAEQLKQQKTSKHEPFL
jgi:hypothetical protein